MTQIHSNRTIRFRKRILIVVMVLLFPFYVLGLVTWGEHIATAQLAGGAIGVFGGQIGGIVQCTCTGGHVISVGPPRPGVFHVVPGFSQVFKYGQTKRPGAWVLGTYVPPSPCLKRIGAFCVPVPHQGNIQLTGTTL